MNINIKAAELARIATDLRAMCGDDDALFADMMEGSSDLHELVQRFHDARALDLEHLAGIAEREAELKARKERKKARADLAKETIGRLIRIAGLTKVELPEATYSVRDGKPGLTILDPDAVPAEYQRTKVEPDKAAINAAFAGAETLPNWLRGTEPSDIVTERRK